MPYDLNQALEFVQKKIDCILIGHRDVSLRCANYFKWNEIKQLAKNNKQTKIFVLVNQFFFEPQLQKLEKFLKKLETLQVDGVYFQDYAVAEIIQDNNLKINLIYHPETLVTSYGQFNFFQKNNINHVVLARELFLTEIAQIAKHKPANMKIELQAQGFMFIMHSRWNMISNFENYNHIKGLAKQKQLWIKEALRKWPNAIYQDQTGTHMFSGYELCVVSVLEKLISYNIDYIRIDNVMQTRQWCEQMTLIYQKLLNELEAKKLTALEIEESINQIKKISSPHAITPAFLGNIKDIYHLEKTNENESKK